MKLHTNSLHVIRFAVILALVLAIGSQVRVLYAEHEEGKMMDHCKKMMEQKEKMGAEIKAQDAGLTEEIAKMNKAPQPEKLELMAALLTHLVEQRSAMNVKKARMEEGMMKHMMGHMQMGKESMSDCPMMKGMKHGEGKAEGELQEHHEEVK